MEDGTPNGQGYNRCGFIVECTRYEREVKSRQINEEKAKSETRRDGFAKHNSKYPKLPQGFRHRRPNLHFGGESRLRSLVGPGRLLQF
jgi:hypothetical protein